MEEKILTSTKKILCITDSYTAFDLDIITHINMAFSNLNQLGIGPIEGFAIDDNGAIWADLNLPLNQLSMVRTYVYLKTRMVFDPPSTSFVIDAMQKQIGELEWRLSHFREDLIPLPQPEEVIVYE